MVLNSEREVVANLANDSNIPELLLPIHNQLQIIVELWWGDLSSLPFPLAYGLFLLGLSAGFSQKLAQRLALQPGFGDYILGILTLEFNMHMVF